MTFAINFNPNITTACEQGPQHFLQPCQDYADSVVHAYVHPAQIVLLGVPVLIVIQKGASLIAKKFEGGGKSHRYISLQETHSDDLEQQSTHTKVKNWSLNDLIDRNFATFLFSGTMCAAGVVLTRAAPFVTNKVCPALISMMEELCSYDFNGVKKQITGSGQV